jgi:hypothetical protein
MAVVGGGWRKSHFSTYFQLSLRYFFTLKSLPINTLTQNPVGKNNIKIVGFNASPTPKKWRWLAVVGGGWRWLAEIAFFTPFYNC